MSAIAKEPFRIDVDLIREAFDRTPVGIAVMSPDGIFRLVNRARCDMMGYPRAALEGEAYGACVPPEDLADDEQHLRGIRESRDPPEAVDTRLVRKDGSQLWVRISANVIRDASGEARYVVSAIVDLTEQREKDRALRQTNAFLAAVVENAPVAIYTSDLDGVVSFWNPAAERTFGFSAEQVIGRYPPFIPDTGKDQSLELRRRVLAGEVLSGLELVRQRADGSVIMIHGSAAPLR